MKPEINIHHADCIEFMASMPDKHYDLAIVDPPYGLNVAEVMSKKTVRGTAMHHPPKAYISQSHGTKPHPTNLILPN